MGVPKFYRWLSERYPQINVVLSDNSLLPEFDNMYLDMNGIIHACTHPNEDTASNTLTMREMMLAIFRYIDRMVSEIAKPKKILFMAIDGCAPRAKMNQQRTRRFRAAQDRLESMEKARQAGQEVDETSTFDSNCITPGTEFMEQVGKHIRWFIRKKIKDDPIWRNLEVVFSGHDVPGEGEHKIMQFIRNLRSRPDYQPNQRHCMYGGDADLIMLGLATHEPHFCLLREVVNFNTKGAFSGKRPGMRETILRQTKEAQFQLMHISMVREYIELDLALGCGRAVDKERLVDDFIFLTFLVGNDFLPHLPTLDIGEHAFDVLFGAYKELLTESEGYLVTSGELQDMPRLEALFKIIGKQEDSILAAREDTEKAFKKKKRGVTKEQLAQQEEEDELAEEARQKAYEEAVQLAMLEAPAAESKASTGLTEAGEVATKDFAGRYYFEKFKVVLGTPPGKAYLEELATRYLEGLMWCLAYYIKGCISWTWYFPYNYGPMLRDMNNCDRMREQITFTLGGPFLPFQQLLGCLPPLSRRLLPSCYQWLMSAEDSPVLEFYPNKFEIDQNGKKTPWEAVVVLPFIDGLRLLAAEALHCPTSKMNRDELGRNKFGKVLCHRFDPSVTETYLSCNPEIGLPDVAKCNSVCIELDPDFNCGHPFRPEVVEGTTSPIAGFPSLGVFPIVNVETDFMGVNVFGSASKYQTIALQFQERKYDAAKVPMAKLLGRSCWCNYPSMHEARVVAVTDAEQEFRAKDGDVIRTQHSHVDAQKWLTSSGEIEEKYLKGAGLPGSAGLTIGRIELMLIVVPLQGLRKDPVTGAVKKVFGSAEAAVPLQMVLWAPPCEDPRFVEQGEQTVAQMFPLDSQVVGTVGRFRGVAGRVVGHHGGSSAAAAADGAKAAAPQRSVDVEFAIRPPEPSFGYIIDASVSEEYFSSADICRALRIGSGVLGRIVGALFVNHASRADLGLNLKRNGQYALLGYARPAQQTHKAAAEAAEKIQEGSVWERSNAIKVIGAEQGKGPSDEEEKHPWEYTVRTINVLLEYRAKFPLLFENLQNLPHEPKFTPAQLFGANQAELELKRCNEWLNNMPLAKMARTPLTTACLSKETVRAIERAADVRQSFVSASGEEKQRVNNVPLDALYRDGFYGATERPTTLNSTVPRLGDRVVNIMCTGVPFALRGTVVTVHSSSGYVEVLFDEEFVGGRPLQGTCSQFRGRLCPWSGLLCVKMAEQVLSQDPAAAVAMQLAAAAAKPKPEFKAAPKKAPAATPAGGAAAAKKQAPAAASTPADLTALLKANLNIGAAKGNRSAQPVPPAPPAAKDIPAPDFEEVSRPRIAIQPSDGTGFAALAAAAGEEFVDVLSELPIEPELAGVIQYLPVHVAPVRPANAGNRAPAHAPKEKTAAATAAAPAKNAGGKAPKPKPAHKAAAPAAAAAAAGAAKAPAAAQESTTAATADADADAGAGAGGADKKAKKASGKALLAALRNKAKDAPAAGAEIQTSDTPPPAVSASQEAAAGKKAKSSDASALPPAPAPAAEGSPVAPAAAAATASAAAPAKSKTMIPAALLMKKKEKK